MHNLPHPDGYIHWLHPDVGEVVPLQTPVDVTCSTRIGHSDCPSCIDGICEPVNIAHTRIAVSATLTNFMTDISYEGESIAVRSSAGESIAVRYSAGESIAVRSSAGESIAVRSSTGESIAVRSSAGESIAVRSSAGESIAVRSSTGESKQQTQHCWRQGRMMLVCPTLEITRKGPLFSSGQEEQQKMAQINNNKTPRHQRLHVWCQQEAHTVLRESRVLNDTDPGSERTTVDPAVCPKRCFIQASRGRPPLSCPDARRLGLLLEPTRTQPD
uniref:Uncharacterized protein n=1 Tax=Timema bartmani TaxID=61472 RepID=A0A7R9F240_9NEOP|nr:unnamed protein product [Timema bartmani]